jgi:hypothetical protein
MALQTQQRNGKVKISEENAWSMVSNTTKGRETDADHTPRLHNYPLEKLVHKFNGKKQNYMYF